MPSPLATILTKTISLPTKLTQIPGWTIFAALLTLPILIYISLNLLLSYNKWTKLGPSSLPSHFGGYLTNVTLGTLFARHRSSTRDLNPYDEPHNSAPGWKRTGEREKAVARSSFLSAPLERRRGTQAHALRFTAPQRERFASEYQVPKVKAAYLAAYEQLRARNQGRVEWRTSVLEGHGVAAFVRYPTGIPQLAARSQREVCHLHESDLSGHVMLSLADAKEVVAKGWGERHGLSGTRLLPLGYTMTYIPRTVDEVDTFCRILQAGVDYMCFNET